MIGAGTCSGGRPPPHRCNGVSSRFGRVTTRVADVDGDRLEHGGVDDGRLTYLFAASGSFTAPVMPVRPSSFRASAARDRRSCSKPKAPQGPRAARRHRAAPSTRCSASPASPVSAACALRQSQRGQPAAGSTRPAASRTPPGPSASAASTVPHARSAGTGTPRERPRTRSRRRDAPLGRGRHRRPRGHRPPADDPAPEERTVGGRPRRAAAPRSARPGGSARPAGFAAPLPPRARSRPSRPCFACLPSTRSPTPSPSPPDQAAPPTSRRGCTSPSPSWSRPAVARGQPRRSSAPRRPGRSSRTPSSTRGPATTTAASARNPSVADHYTRFVKSRIEPSDGTRQSVVDAFALHSAELARSLGLLDPDGGGSPGNPHPTAS